MKLILGDEIEKFLQPRVLASLKAWLKLSRNFLKKKEMIIKSIVMTGNGPGRKWKKKSVNVLCYVSFLISFSFVNDRASQERKSERKAWKKKSISVKQKQNSLFFNQGWLKYFWWWNNTFTSFVLDKSFKLNILRGQNFFVKIWN